MRTTTTTPTAARRSRPDDLSGGGGRARAAEPRSASILSPRPLRKGDWDMHMHMRMCMCMYGLVSGERDYTVRRNGCTRAREYGSTCVRRAFGRSPSPPPQRCHGGSSLGAAARRRVYSRATEPAARTRGYAAPRVPSPSSERHGAGRRRARASVALLLLQARRAAPATTPRRLSLGGVEVGRARSRGRGGRHRCGRGHGGPYGRRARC